MGKISFTKLTPGKYPEDKMVTINEQEVSVKQYLPIEEKLLLIQRVLDAVLDTTGFLNPVKLEIYFQIEILKAYTNINFTEKQLEDIPKVYDKLELNGVLDTVIKSIPETEYSYLQQACDECAMHVINYTSSFVGSVKALLQDYKTTDINIKETMQEINNPEAVGLLQDILTKLG